MQIPQTNISAYRSRTGSQNAQNQLIPTICNENKANVQYTGSQVALISGTLDEGARYRGYGCYRLNAPCNLCNVYCPIFYNNKSNVKADNAWFL